MDRNTKVIIGAAALAAALIFVGVSKSRLSPKAGIRAQKSSTAVSQLPRAAVPTVAITPVPAEVLDKSSSLLENIAGASLHQVYDLLSGLSHNEIVKLAQKLAQLPRGSLSDAKLSLFFRGWTLLDTTGAFQTAVVLQSRAAQSIALNAVFDGVDATAADKLLQALDQFPAGTMDAQLRQSLIGKGIAKMSEADPAGAAKWLDSPSAAQVDTDTRHRVAENWGSQDPQAAIDWAKHYEDGSAIRRSAMQGAISGWWTKDPDGAAAYAKEASSNSFEGQQLASMIASRIAVADPAKALQWTSSLDNAEARKLSELTLGLAWTVKDPQGATQWVQTLPSQQAQSMIPAMAGLWARNDPEAAGAWVSSINGPARDRSAATYSSAIVDSDPAAAMQWALSISDPTLRDTTAEKTARAWLMRDPQAAGSWIRNAPLSDADKRRLLGGPGTP